MAEVVVAARGGVAADDVFAIYGGREGDVLADGETQDVVRTGEGEAVAGDGSDGDRERERTDMAVLGETTVFCWRTNCWKAVGVSTGARARLV